MKKSTQQILAYSFGVVFIVTILVIVIIFDKPTPLQQLVFRVVLALSAAGAAAMIPGFLSVSLGNTIRAGGAIAVFVIIYFANPAEIATNNDPGKLPTTEPKTIVDNYLKSADSLNFEESWIFFASYFHNPSYKENAKTAFNNVRVPLGAAEDRNLQGVNKFTSLPGLPPAHHRVFLFRTNFQNQKAIREIVSVMSEDGVWKISGHGIDVSE